MKMRGIAFALWLAFLLAAEYVLLVPLNLTSVPFWGMVLVFGTLLLMTSRRERTFLSFR